MHSYMDLFDWLKTFDWQEGESGPPRPQDVVNRTILEMKFEIKEVGLHLNNHILDTLQNHQFWLADMGHSKMVNILPLNANSETKKMH